MKLSNLLKLYCLFTVSCFLTALTLYSCGGSPDQTGETQTSGTAPEVPSTPQCELGNVKGKLGLVFTAAHEKQIYDSGFTPPVKNLRYMAKAYRVWDNGIYDRPELVPAYITEKGVWGSPENSPRAMLSRAEALRAKCADCEISIMYSFYRTPAYDNDVLTYIGWPFKGMTPNELIEGRSNADPVDHLLYMRAQKYSYELTYSTMVSLTENLTGNFTYEAGGELWLARLALLRDAIHEGALDATAQFYEDYPEHKDRMRISLGAFQYTNRVYKGKPLSESIKDLQVGNLERLNGLHGEISMNFYPSEEELGGYPSLEALPEVQEWNEIDSVVAVVGRYYDNITFSVSEWGISLQDAGDKPTTESVVADRPLIAYTLKRLLSNPKVRAAHFYSVRGSDGKFTPLCFECDIPFWTSVATKDICEL